MEKIKILSLLACLMVVFSGCHKEEEGPARPEPREQVGRTVLVYIVGDAGESWNELSDLLKDNFDDMEKGMKEVDYSKCNLVVYSELVNDVPHLISIKKVGNQVVADTLFTYEEQNPLSKKVMSSVISQTVNYFPADSYGLVFLSHSSSWVPAGNDANARSIGYYRKTQMDITDFREVLSSSFPKPLKFILFDSCFMQSAEVAYELRDCADFIIGSPMEIPGPGAPYEKLVPELFTETNLAANIAKSYYSYYQERYDEGHNNTNENWTGGISVSVINTSAIDELAVETRRIIPAYIRERQDLSSLRKKVQRYNFSSSDANYDLNDLILNLTGGADNDRYKAWRQSFDKAVTYWGTPKNYSVYWSNNDYIDSYGMVSMEKATGLSVYIPYGTVATDMNQYFHSLQWYSVSGWNETGW